ncbi:MAG: SgcJ/EcaC family oxidoreductase [Richelia sp. RM2_1_2]|nr:SgcJ/EcaC family oxidoreductase [Richelia sp. SM2_1_7]NJN11268.1 SgcJ/EcaC family oxidoreductase [Richelia sp. RM1_1_1]NJO26898.1 SgcJ/EcaC family oxidoreductase [Richelia sp. SL_2_1]NJO58872.1 SgcJ/EcaC family oxidoreductase [Richelia sp. RM2_1_2]
MVAINNTTTDEAEIRQIIDNWVEFVRAKDIDGLMSHYVDDSVLFDIMPPLKHQGASAYRQLWEQCFPYFQGDIGYEIRDLNITVGSDVAFSHSLNRMSGTTTNGEEIDNWMRVTVCYQKIDGKWMVIHDHVSVPINMENSKALFDLKP